MLAETVTHYHATCRKAHVRRNAHRGVPSSHRTQQRHAARHGRRGRTGRRARTPRVGRRTPGRLAPWSRRGARGSVRSGIRAQTVSSTSNAAHVNDAIQMPNVCPRFATDSAERWKARSRVRRRRSSVRGQFVRGARRLACCVHVCVCRLTSLGREQVRACSCRDS